MGNSDKLINAIAHARTGVSNWTITDRHFNKAFHDSCKKEVCYNSSVIAFIKGTGNKDNKLTIDELYLDLANNKNTKQVVDYLKESDEEFKEKDIIRLKEHLGKLRNENMGSMIIAEVYSYNDTCRKKNVKFNDIPKWPTGPSGALSKQ
jgi:hypothetical protein